MPDRACHTLHVPFYRERVLPHLVDRACGTAELRRWRERATADLSGVVLEVGYGSGLNLDHYPAAVERVLAVEPSPRARAMASKREARAAFAVEHVGLDGASIPLADHSCDAALATFTLCTVPDVATALAEVRRVVKPGGLFAYVEHGLSPDPGVARWQHRLEPLQRRLAGGCHLTREPEALVAAAGFEVLSTESRYARGPKPWSWFTLGLVLTP